MGQDKSLGFAKVTPQFQSDFSSPGVLRKVEWLKFKLSDSTASSSHAPEVLIEITTVRGGSRETNDKQKEKVQASEAMITENRAEKSNASIRSSPLKRRLNRSPETDTGFSLPIAPPQSQRANENDGPITLEAAIHNNELFMEFLDYLNSVKAPPYLQFLMNVDALRQYAAMTLSLDSKDVAAIESYFKSGPLSEKKREELKMIKHDAADVFATHFSENARYRIPLDPGMQKEIQEWVTLSDRLDSDGFYSGGPIGPGIFLPAYKWVSGVLEEVYFPKFKESDTYNRFLDRAHFSTLNFTLEDDTTSIYSHDSFLPGTAGNHEMPSRGGRSRTASSDDLSFIQESEENVNFRDQVKKIATEISITREKISAIDDKIERLRAIGKLDEDEGKRLQKERRALEANVNLLLKMINDIDSTDMRNDDLWVDLRNVRVIVKASQSVPDSSTIIGSLWTTTVGSVLNAMSDYAFVIEIYDNSTPSSSVPTCKEHPAPLSSVRRNYSDFQLLHIQLKKEFPKIGKVPLPEVSASMSVGLMERNLKVYLELLISDEFVCQSATLREFFSIENSIDGPAVMPFQLGKKFKDVMNSATSLITGGDLEAGSSTINIPKRAPSPVILSKSQTSSARDSAPSVTFDSIPVGIPTAELPPISQQNATLHATGEEETLVVRPVEELSDQQVDMIIDIFFAIILETFELQEPNQWLRRKLLGVFKQLLRQAYGDTLNKSISFIMGQAVSENSVLNYINLIKSALYPEGIFIKDRPPIPVRTEEERFAMMVEARTAFLSSTPDIVQSIAGRYNAVCGMTRVFNALQNKDFNKAIIYSCLDIALKLFFSEVSE